MDFGCRQNDLDVIMPDGDDQIRGKNRTETAA